MCLWRAGQPSGYRFGLPAKRAVLESGSCALSYESPRRVDSAEFQMGDPLHDRDTMPSALSAAVEAARTYLEKLDGLPARSPRADEAAAHFGGPLPEEGDGSLAALALLTEEGVDAATRSAGPRFFHFVTGGSTPAALAADWFASALDNNAGMWVSSPLGARLEQVALSWLKDLLGLPDSWGGVMTTGATMANFTALGAARQWWGHKHDVDIASGGMAGLPSMPVFAGGFVHASALKALAMLGIGSKVRKVASDAAGRIDLDGLDLALRDLRGAPALVLATAGEVNAGGFDPIFEMAEIAHRHGSWLHVDGAFGLFARVTPTTAHLVRGVDEADSAIADGHKWLNVPYDCGFAFVRDGSLLNEVFGLGAPYFPAAEADHPDYLYLGPEMSRRARGLAVWATLAAYGRTGYRQMVERHVGLAKRLADQIDETDLDELNRSLGKAVIEDGRVYYGTTVYRGVVAFRPAISNWRTTAKEVDEILPIARELGMQLLGTMKVNR
jgi:glutamate/tyrosine decarboxylase-like PLP-dependent enzyme